MGTISRTGITGASAIQPTHITNIIDALDGTSTTTTVVASGSFSGSLTGLATTATTASYVANVQVTNNTTGTGPYSIPFVNVSAFNPALAFTTPVSQLVDASGLTYNATSNTITATASFATTASYAINGGSGGGIFIATGSKYATTNNVDITGSLNISGSINVTAGITGSMLGTASFATTASFALNAGGGAGFPFTGSAGVSGSMRIKAPTNATLALVVTGSSFMSGSFIGFAGELDAATNLTANKNGIINLAGLGGSGFNGKFVLPNAQPDQPVAGAVYWDDAAGRLYVYKLTDPPGWVSTPLG
jgi:hypothetical protein